MSNDIGTTNARTLRHSLLLTALSVVLVIGGASWSVEAAPTRAEAIRFLEQATFGPTPAMVDRARQVGFSAFLDEQFSQPLPAYPELGYWPFIPSGTCDVVCLLDNYTVHPLQVRFFKKAVTGADQLRQRVTFALSQIFVVSAEKVDLMLPSRLLPYLKVLDRNAFGNFRQLLTDITLNPAMGVYLDMRGSHRFAPNENYARELLQLFTIGVDELNLDGTPKLDPSGRPIPTYDQRTVTEFARVLTGWNLAPPPAEWIENYFDPMVPWEFLHDAGSKVLLNGATLPGGQTAVADLQAALDNIFAHPNVAPFISQRLIQHLVTSNPSPAYVQRVATVFNQTRGDMKAVIRAILLDPHARTAPTADPNYGHLREPVLWITSLLRAFGATAATTDFALGEMFLPTNLRMAQDLFQAPSVFNFFPPDNIVAGDTIRGPEFAIHSTSTAVARANFAYQVVYKKMWPFPPVRPKGTWIDLSSLQLLALDPAGLVAHLNQQLFGGAMAPKVRDIVIGAVSRIPFYSLQARVREAVYLIVTSPQYLVER